MRWTPSNIFHSVNHLLSGKSHRLSGDAVDRVEAIRLEMLDCLGVPGRIAYPSLERKLRFAKDAQDLWYLRAEVMGALASIKGERIAQQIVAEFSGKFSGLIPSGFAARAKGV